MISQNEYANCVDDVFERVADDAEALCTRIRDLTAGSLSSAAQHRMYTKLVLDMVMSRTEIRWL